MELDKYNAADIIKEYDVMVGGVDNFSSRHLLNEVYFDALSIDFYATNVDRVKGCKLCGEGQPITKEF